MSTSSRLARLACLGAAACCGAVPADLAARLGAIPGASAHGERVVLEVELASPNLSGLFDAVLIARVSPPAVRVQLLPELGAPILDVVAEPGRVAAFLHGSGVAEWRGAEGDPPPALGLLFGITLLEQRARLDPARVRCWTEGNPPRLELTGLFPGVTLTDAEFGSAGVGARTFHYGPVTWRDRLATDRGEVDGPGFSLRARVREREAADDLTDADFALRGGG